MKFFLCEFLNLINIVGQIYFMDFFLGGEFTKYGTDVLAMTEKEPEDREDPMARVFPKVTKCTFHKFGPSGTVEVWRFCCSSDNVVDVQACKCPTIVNYDSRVVI